LPELFNSGRITGEPEEYILNAEEEKLAKRGASAAMTVSKMRPSPPVVKQNKKLRSELFDIDRIYPFLKAQKEYAIPRLKKSWK